MQNKLLQRIEAMKLIEPSKGKRLMKWNNFIKAAFCFLLGYIIPFVVLAFFTWQRLARSRFPHRDFERDWQVFWYHAPQAGMILGAILFFAVLRIRANLNAGRLHIIWRIILLSIPAVIRRFSLRPKRENDFSIGEEMFFQVFMIAIVFLVLEIFQSHKMKRILDSKDAQ